MKRKKFALTFALLFALLITLAPAMPAAAATYEAKLEGQLDNEVNADVEEWGIGDLPGATVSFELGAETTITMEFDAPIKFTGNWTGIATNVPVDSDEDAEAVLGGITSFKVDGNELGARKVPLINRDNGGTLTIDIARQWGGEYDAYGLIEMAPFSKLEITFILGAEVDFMEEGAAPPPPAEPSIPDEPSIPAFDPSGEYHVFIGVVSNTWIFRDPWHSDLGEFGSAWDSHGGNYFNNLFETNDSSVHKGTFTDAVIKGNGTYKVTLKDADFDSSVKEGPMEFLHQLFLSSDIPLEGAPVQFTDIRVRFNGVTRGEFDTGYVYGIDSSDNSKFYYEVGFINTWNNDLEEMMVPTPLTDIEIEFTISGFAYDKEEEDVPPTDVAPTDEAPAATSPSPSPAGGDDDDEGGFPGWAIGLIIGGAAIIIVVVVVVVMKGKKG
ncbi:MAG: hypothetical protein LBI19_08965 [Oscillospiraceae bacterium]|jgi:hypothetical protein|nr:hypothetical protein [Oscillospiraceae bacterium]